jgi:hypothetical protein
MILTRLNKMGHSVKHTIFIYLFLAYPIVYILLHNYKSEPTQVSFFFHWPGHNWIIGRNNIVMLISLKYIGVTYYDRKRVLLVFDKKIKKSLMNSKVLFYVD